MTTVKRPHQSGGVDAETRLEFEDIFKGLKEIVDQIKLDNPRYMEVYTKIQEICSNSAGSREKDEPENKADRKKARMQKTAPKKLAKLAKDAKDALKSNPAVAADDDVLGIPSKGIVVKLNELSDERVNNILMDLLVKEGDELIKSYAREWDEFCFTATVLNGICDYLNRFKLQREDSKKIYDIVLTHWTRIVYENLKKKIATLSLAMIEKDRTGSDIQKNMIKSAVDSFIQIGPINIYETNFEDQFLKETQAFYANESTEFLQQNSITDYMKKVELRLQEEQTRVREYLHDVTLPRLLKTCEKALIENHLDALYPEFKELLKQDKNEDMERMYSLISRVNIFGGMYDDFENWVGAQGQALIENLSETTSSRPNDLPQAFMDSTYGHYSKYKNLVKTAFQDDLRFGVSLDVGCKKFINQAFAEAQASQKPPLLLVRYCDGLLKMKNIGDDDFEKSSTEMMTILKFIDNLDVFQQQYRKMLVSRFIQQRTAGEHFELVLIMKLKHAYGFEFTHKLEKTFQDFRTSRDLNEQFKAYKIEKNVAPSPLDFNIQVVASNNWPFTRTHDEFILPPILERCVTSFTEFYSIQQKDRQLSWLYNMSRAELKFNKAYTLQTTTFQMAILLMFNSSISYKLSEISEATKLTDENLKQSLQPLLDGSLLKCDTHPNLTPDSTITLFTDYKNKRHQLNFAKVIRNEPERRNDDVRDEKEIETKRRYEVQAAIVRIMKMRKSLSPQALIGEVVDQVHTRFTPEVKMIKKCIEDLIEKNYLQKSEDNENYEYMA